MAATFEVLKIKEHPNSNPSPQTIRVVYLTALLLIAATLLVPLIQMSSRDTTSPKAVNVVTDITPVRTATDDTVNLLQLLQETPILDRAAVLKAHNSQLTAEIVRQFSEQSIYTLYGLQSAPHINRIAYYFSAELNDVAGMDREGTYHNGYLQDQLLAAIYHDDSEKPIVVAVLCFNGLLDVPIENLSSIGAGVSSITIEPGKSLLNYVSYQEAMWIAEKNHLPIEKRHIHGTTFESITLDQALALEHATDTWLVRIVVTPGQFFHLY